MKKIYRENNAKIRNYLFLTRQLQGSFTANVVDFHNKFHGDLWRIMAVFYHDIGDAITIIYCSASHGGYRDRKRTGD